MFVSNCYAEDNAIISNYNQEKNMVTIQLYGSHIYGLSFDFSYDKSVFEFQNCSSKYNYDININQNKIVLDTYLDHNERDIIQCRFKILDNTKDAEIVYSNILYTDSKSLSKNKDLKMLISKSYGETTYDTSISNPNTGNNLKILLISMLMICSLVLISFLMKKKFNIKNNTKKVMIVILGMMILPFTCFALTGDLNANLKIDQEEINAIRKHLLGTKKLTSEEIKIADFDNDNKVTIHDLVLAKIEYYKPAIEMTEETEGTAKYFTKVTKKVTVSGARKITSLKYCITTSKSCTPSKTISANKEKIVFDAKYSNNSSAQRVCVFAKDEDGLERNLCDTKTYLVDDEKPTLEFKNASVEISTSRYNIANNIKTEKYGVGGGTKVCDKTDSLTEGEHTISCTLTGNNGLKKQGTFKLIFTKKSETAVFYGDSITYGSGNNGYSWANYIGEHYGITTTNRGKGGWRVSNTNNAWINTLVVEDKGKSYDFVILHGGCNDVRAQVSMGTFTSGDFSGSYDSTTFSGGLETYLYNATKQWPNAKIGYIINYQTPNNEYRVDAISAPYYAQMRKILKKWNVSYLDLYSGSTSSGVSYSDLLKVTTSTYIPDTVHLNGEGYAVISPHIYQWMRTLSTYSR